MRLSDIWSIRELKKFNKEKEGHFFDSETMRFFSSRIAPRVYHLDNGIGFITSEQFDENSPRLYTVRIMGEDGRIHSIGEFQKYKTLAQARKAINQI